MRNFVAERTYPAFLQVLALVVGGYACSVLSWVLGLGFAGAFHGTTFHSIADPIKLSVGYSRLAPFSPYFLLPLCLGIALPRLKMRWRIALIVCSAFVGGALLFQRVGAYGIAP